MLERTPNTNRMFPLLDIPVLRTLASAGGLVAQAMLPTTRAVHVLAEAYPELAK